MDEKLEKVVITAGLELIERESKRYTAIRGRNQDNSKKYYAKLHFSTIGTGGINGRIIRDNHLLVRISEELYKQIENERKMGDEDAYGRVTIEFLTNKDPSEGY